MKRLSKLSKECIANKGLCCENRTPPFLLPSEIENLITKEISNQFVFGKCSAKPKSLCAFFKEPYCSIYEKRPVDCRTYPISISLENNSLVFIIDKKCPAVKKGLVSDNFIQTAIEQWKQENISRNWLGEYIFNDNEEDYEWISIKEYQNYKKQLKK